jgi:hypothetical protein
MSFIENVFKYSINIIHLHEISTKNEVSLRGGTTKQSVDLLPMPFFKFNLQIHNIY